MPVARTIHVEGKVQGVFFRDWTVGTARRMGVTGWVRNRRNGNVEIFAVGEPAVIDRFIEHLREGSPASRVDRLHIEESRVEEIEGFSRRQTV